MPFPVFRTISYINNSGLVCHKKEFCHTKTYNQSSVEQLDVCTVRLRHKVIIAKCRSFLVLGKSQALIGMPDIKLLDILKIMCNVMGNPQFGRMFHSQTIQ